MRLNWVSYDFGNYEGYGRFSQGYIRTLRSRGVDINAIVNRQLDVPRWVQNLDFSALTISCLAPDQVHEIPGRHWMYTMTEGDIIPDFWIDRLQKAKPEKLLVPSQYCAEAFEGAGIPIHVVPGGFDGIEFPLRQQPKETRTDQYTFLALADRGTRKGWGEVWSAFYKAFPDTPDVRLIIKARPYRNDMLGLIRDAEPKDPRIQFVEEDLPSLRTLFDEADCFVCPTRSEGWGMPQREAAAYGLPVITTRYSGLDDGTIDCWAIPVNKYRLVKVPRTDINLNGCWAIPNVDEIADHMLRAYRHRKAAAEFGLYASRFLHGNQTWEHATDRLMRVLGLYDGFI